MHTKEVEELLNLSVVAFLNAQWRVIGKLNREYTAYYVFHNLLLKHCLMCSLFKRPVVTEEEQHHRYCLCGKTV